MPVSPRLRGGRGVPCAGGVYYLLRRARREFARQAVALRASPMAIEMDIVKAQVQALSVAVAGAMARHGELTNERDHDATTTETATTQTCRADRRPRRRRRRRRRRREPQAATAVAAAVGVGAEALDHAPPVSPARSSQVETTQALAALALGQVAEVLPAACMPIFEREFAQPVLAALGAQGGGAQDVANTVGGLWAQTRMAVAASGTWTSRDESKGVQFDVEDAVWAFLTFIRGADSGLPRLRVLAVKGAYMARMGTLLPTVRRG